MSAWPNFDVKILADGEGYGDYPPAPIGRSFAIGTTTVKGKKVEAAVYVPAGLAEPDDPTVRQSVEKFLRLRAEG